MLFLLSFFFFQAEDGIRDLLVTGVQTCALPIYFNRESIYGGVNLNFPLYEGGARKADVRESEARQRQAELSYADAVKTVRVEVENAYLDYLTQQGVIKFLQDQLVYAEDNYNAVAKQYEFGLANSLDVI